MKVIFGIIGVIICYLSIGYVSAMLEKYAKNRFVYWTISIIIFVTMFALYRIIFQSLFGQNSLVKTNKKMNSRFKFVQGEM